MIMLTLSVHYDVWNVSSYSYYLKSQARVGREPWYSYTQLLVALSHVTDLMY